MKKYIKENQVYTVQEGSELEVQLMADGFEEFVEDGSELETPKAIKNLILKTPGIYVAEGEFVELEQNYADQVNKDLKQTFPDVAAVLELVEDVSTQSEQADATE